MPENNESEPIERFCSIKQCQTKLDFQYSLSQFSRNWNKSIRAKLYNDIRKKFLAIWNNPNVSIFCCSHTKAFNKFMEQQKKEQKLLTRARKIREKHKLEIDQSNCNKENNLKLYKS